LIKQGAKEITLLGQNVNRYYFGKRSSNPARSDFAELLREVSELPGLKWLRFTSPHPQHMGEDVLEVMANSPTICRQLHLPVQSGNDQILRRMARGYTVEQFQKILKKARELMPDIALSTDIIVGFPSETEEQLQDSLKLCQQESFDQVYIGKYSPRRNTPAFKWDNIPLKIKKTRWHQLNEVLKKTAAHNLSRDIGKTLEVLVDTVDKNNLATGRTSQNRKVLFQVGKRGQEFIGKFINVKINSAKTFLLEGIF